jgi:hypothetical protein
MKRPRLRSTLLSFLLLLTVTPLFAAQSPYTGGPYAFAGTIQAENYDNGLEGESYHDTSAGNAFNIYRFDGVDVGQIVAGEYHIGNLDTLGGEWTEYTVNVPASGSYNLTFRYSSAYPNATSFRIWLGSSSTTLVAITPSITVTSTGAWTTYTMPAAVAATVPAGGEGNSRILRIAFEKGAFNLDWIRFTAATPTCTDATITNPANRTVAFGGTATFTVTAGGSPAPTIRWYKGLPGSGVSTGVTGPTLQITGVKYGDHAGSYYATATNTCNGTKVATSSAALLRVPCDGDDETGPDEMLKNVADVLGGGGGVCEWTAPAAGFGLNWNPNSRGYNKPVINAATAFIKEPIRTGTGGWDMNVWWSTYLKGELGENGLKADGTPHWYFGAQEFGSYDYQKYNLSSVLAVHYHAHRTNNTAIKQLAARWLRASVTVLSLAAVPQYPISLHSNGLQSTVGGARVSPYSALAGERSPWGFWVEPDRNIFMAQAIGLLGDTWGERTANRDVRRFITDRWVGFTPPGCLSGCDQNAYGLTSAQATSLRNVVQNNQLPATLVGDFLPATLRTQVSYHFVGWPDGRATLMEDSTETNTTPTMGVVFYKSSRQAHFLYPWEGEWWFPTAPTVNRLHRHGIAGSDPWGALNLATGLIQAGHNVTTPQHPAETVTISGVPWGSPPTRFHVLLRPTAAPLVD